MWVVIGSDAFCIKVDTRSIKVKTFCIGAEALSIKVDVGCRRG